jgi:D-serine deaminase-like pyridoxal phosphate-dependent protein
VKSPWVATILQSSYYFPHRSGAFRPAQEGGPVGENHLQAYERYRNLFRRERLPLAFVDLEAFDRNIEFVASTQRTTDKTIRLHSKSLRCVSLIRRILERGGPVFRGVMTYTMEDASFLAAHGLDDFIVSYPTVQPSDLELFTEMTRQGSRVDLVVDCEDHLEALSRAGSAAGVELRACLEVDLSYRPLGTPVHLGVRRSPVRTVEAALALARSSLRLPGVSIRSLMGYEAHIASVNDDIPGERWKNRMMRAVKSASIRELTGRRGRIVAALRGEGLDLDMVNGGGSGSLLSTGSDPSVTEVTAGSAFYAPGLFHHFRDVSFRPSAFFALQIVRRPAPDIVTCHGGGYVASGPAGQDKLPTPMLPRGFRYLPLEGAGEVQTPLKIPGGAPDLDLGDPVFFQHAKSGELAERFNELYLVQGERIVDRVKTYRGDGKSFL